MAKHVCLFTNEESTVELQEEKKYHLMAKGGYEGVTRNVLIESKHW